MRRTTCVIVGLIVGIGCGDDDALGVDAGPSDAATAADAPSFADGGREDAALTADASDERDGGGGREDAGNEDAGPAPMLGEVLPAGSCSAGVPGARCERYEVRGCPGTNDVFVNLRIRGSGGPTVLLGSGTGGGSFLADSSAGADRLVADLVAAGFTVVERAWDNRGGWMATTESTGTVATQACRLASLVAFLARDDVVCAHGHSGGSLELSAALAFHDIDRSLTAASFSGGPIHDLTDVCWRGDDGGDWQMTCERHARDMMSGCSPTCLTRQFARINAAYGEANPCGGRDAAGSDPAAEDLLLLDADSPTGERARTTLATTLQLVIGQRECRGDLGPSAVEWAARLRAAGTPVLPDIVVEGAPHNVFASGGNPFIVQFMREHCR